MSRFLHSSRFLLSLLILLSPIACASGGVPKTAGVSGGAGRTVLVLPFTVSGDDRLSWFGEALSRDLTAEVAHSGARGILASPLPTTSPAAGAVAPGPAPTTAPTPAQIGRDAGADLVVWGTVQVVGDELRISGEVVTTRDQRPLGALRVQGPLRDLFRLEDDLSQQLGRLLGAPVATATNTAITPGPYSYRYVPPTAYNYTSSYYSPYYVYPYSRYYSYPYRSYSYYSGFGHHHDGLGHVPLARPRVYVPSHYDSVRDTHAGASHSGSGTHANRGYVSGGHVSGGHVSGGNVSGGHVSGGHASGGHASGGHVSGGHAGGGHAGGGHH